MLYANDAIANSDNMIKSAAIFALGSSLYSISINKDINNFYKIN